MEWIWNGRDLQYGISKNRLLFHSIACPVYSSWYVAVCSSSSTKTPRITRGKLCAAPHDKNKSFVSANLLQSILSSRAVNTPARLSETLIPESLPPYDHVKWRRQFFEVLNSVEEELKRKCCNFSDLQKAADREDVPIANCNFSKRWDTLEISSAIDKSRPAFSDGGSISKVGGPKTNDQIAFSYNPCLACPHVTCPTYVGSKPTVLASSFCSPYPQTKF